MLISRLFAALCSAWFSLNLLNQSTVTEIAPARSEDSSEGLVLSEEPEQQHELNSAPHAGKSIDLTLFVCTRAADSLVHYLWARRKTSRMLRKQWTAVDAVLSKYTDSVVFAASSSAAMWGWFYLPHKLPPAYRAWITSIAEIDDRLIEALRRARSGEFIYGKDTGQAPLLQSMCRDYNLPIDWGDPAKVVPVSQVYRPYISSLGQFTCSQTCLGMS